MQTFGKIILLVFHINYKIVAYVTKKRHIALNIYIKFPGHVKIHFNIDTSLGLVQIKSSSATHYGLQIYIYTHTHTHTHIYIYIYIKSVKETVDKLSE